MAPLRDADPLRPAEAPHLLAYLATIPDPRRPAGCRHPLACILGLAAAAVLAGARSMAAIAEWAADAPPMVRAALGARRDALTGQRTVPAESTIRRTLGHLDDQALAVAVGAWLADRDRRERRRHCCIWANGTTDEAASGASAQVETHENFSKRSIARAIRRVLGSQWRTWRQLTARCNSAVGSP
ncbi:MAG TPA: transposase family protein [Candidatus Eisenbacteria bacterium]